MLKKYGTILIAVLVLSTLTAGVVFARETSGPKTHPETRERHRLLVGQVIRLGESDFDLESPNGDVHTAQVTGETVFRIRSSEGDLGDTANFEDLTLGRWVGVNNRRNAEGEFSARLVVILPEDFDPADIQARPAVGEVTQVNNGQSTFEILTAAGKTLTFGVDENTRFAGIIASLTDLEKGLKVSVLAVEQEDGTLLAKLVGARNPENIQFEKIGGKISAIGADSLTITTRDGESRTFPVTDETRFASRDGSYQSLDDLEVGLPVLILVDRDGSPDQAAAVLVLDEAILGLERMQGEVQSAGGDHLTLIVNGETVNFTVGEHARIQGRGISDFNDIKNGMKAMVLYSVEEDGTLLARGILVGAGTFPGQ